MSALATMKALKAPLIVFEEASLVLGMLEVPDPELDPEAEPEPLPAPVFGPEPLPEPLPELLVVAEVVADVVVVEAEADVLDDLVGAE